MIDVRHVTTGPADQVGGIASVVRDSTAICENDTFNISSHFVDRGRFQDSRFEVLDTTWHRVRHKINRLCARDPSLHPYRYPGINVDHFERGDVADADVLHIHKPSLWKQAIQIGHQPDGPALVVHAHSVDGFTGGCVLEQDCPRLSKGCTECPIVASPLQFLPPRGLSARERQLRRGRPHIIANSRATLDAIERSGILPDDVGRSIVYPAVDSTVFYDESPDRVDVDSSGGEPSARIGFISYSVENPNKGFEDYVDALHRVETERPVQGVVAGNCRTDMEASHPDLEFTGELKTDVELRRFYNSLDVLVVPSVSESFGKVSVEAQFCGTPVVCYDRGGLPETVLNGVTGRVTDQNTSSHLAAAVQDVLTWTDVAQRFKSGDATQFLSHFQATTIADEYRSLYRRLHAASQ